MHLSPTSQPDMRVLHFLQRQLVLFDVKLRAHIIIPLFLTEAVFVTLRAEPVFVFSRGLTPKSSKPKKERICRQSAFLFAFAVIIA